MLATIGRERAETHPEIPTVRESGGPDMLLDGWFGLFGPAGMPREIVERIESATRTVAADPEVRKKLLALGLVPDILGPQAFRERIEQDLKLYADVRTRAKLVVE